MEAHLCRTRTSPPPTSTRDVQVGHPRPGNPARACRSGRSAASCGSGDARAVLRVLQKRPAFREARALRRCATRRLALAFFNEANRVIADIIVRAEHGRTEWVDSRKFRAWRDGGCKGPRPERKGDLKGKVDALPTGWHDALDEHNAMSAGLGAPRAVIG